MYLDYTVQGMGWEAQCGADLRHLLHTLQHLPMDPQQAATNVAPLVTLCTTRFAALPAQPASQTPPAHPSDSPPHPRHLHRSLTESDAHMHQQSSPTQSQTLKARGNDQHGNQGIGDVGQGRAQQQRSGPLPVQSGANGLQNGQIKTPSKPTPDVTTAVPPDLQLQEPNEEHSRADGNGVSEPAVALEGQTEQSHLRSISEDAIELDIDQQHPLIDGVQQAADVEQAADGDIRTSNDGDMVATNNEPLAASNLEVSALLMQSDVQTASDLADVVSDKPA